ncbi:MAG: hypothetical protein WD850_03480 [Candidatus Spechtbacterales bacterium]
MLAPTSLAFASGECRTVTFGGSSFDEIKVPQAGLYAGEARVIDTSNREVNTANNFYADERYVGTLPMVDILAPEPGATLEKGKNYTFRWRVLGGATSGTLSIRLLSIRSYPPVVLRQGATTGTSFSLTIPEHIPAGDYRLEISVGAATSSSLRDPILNIVDSGTLPADLRLIQAEQGTVYAVKDGLARWIPSPQVFNESGFRWGDIEEVSFAVVQSFQQTSLIRAENSPSVYYLIGERKLWIPTASAFRDRGFSFSDVMVLPAREVDAYHTADLVSSFSGEVYYLNRHGRKHHIPNPETFNSYGNRWEDVVLVWPSLLEMYPDSLLVRHGNSPEVYLIDHGVKRWVTSWNALASLGMGTLYIVPVNSTEFNSYPEGERIE